MNISDKQKLVLDVIYEYPEAADDDALLLAMVWEREGWDRAMSVHYNLKRVTRPETITRRRRELFNMGLIEYSKTASKRRMTAYNAEREFHSSLNVVKGL